MRSADRRACGAVGGLAIVTSLFFAWNTCRSVMHPPNPPGLDGRLDVFAWQMTYVPMVRVTWILCTVVMVLGVLVCVKAWLAPPHFWSNTGWHLLYAMGIANLLLFIPFFPYVIVGWWM